MPTVWRIGHFRFHFYSREAGEPARVYVRNADGECKFWLDPIQLAGNRGVAPPDVRQAGRLVFEYQTLRLAKYHAYHHR